MSVRDEIVLFFVDVGVIVRWILEGVLVYIFFLYMYKFDVCNFEIYRYLIWWLGCRVKVVDFIYWLRL